MSGERDSERRENLNLNLNLFLFYISYKLGRMPLFIWPLIQKYNLSTTEKYSSNYLLSNYACQHNNQQYQPKY